MLIRDEFIISCCLLEMSSTLTLILESNHVSPSPPSFRFHGHYNVWLRIGKSQQAVGIPPAQACASKDTGSS
jgi:hypothetical protein